MKELLLVLLLAGCFSSGTTSTDAVDPIAPESETDPEFQGLGDETEISKNPGNESGELREQDESSSTEQEAGEIEEPVFELPQNFSTADNPFMDSFIGIVQETGEFEIRAAANGEECGISDWAWARIWNRTDLVDFASWNSTEFVLPILEAPALVKIHAPCGYSVVINASMAVESLNSEQIYTHAYDIEATFNTTELMGQTFTVDLPITTTQFRVTLLAEAWIDQLGHESIELHSDGFIDARHADSKTTWFRQPVPSPDGLELVLDGVFLQQSEDVKIQISTRHWDSAIQEFGFFFPEE